MEIICLECGWIGSPDNLVSKTEELDDNNYSYCPDCGSDDFEEEEEEID